VERLRAVRHVVTISGPGVSVAEQERSTLMQPLPGTARQVRNRAYGLVIRKRRPRPC